MTLTNAEWKAIDKILSRYGVADRAAAAPDIALHFKAIGRAEAIAEAARLCMEPEPECCHRPVHGGYDDPPECCGNYEPRPKDAEECAAAIRALADA